MTWRGVFPAITTPFLPDMTLDEAFLAEHAAWMLSAGCAGLVALGSLGEAATLSAPEKQAILATCVRAAGGSPVIAGVSALSTAEAAACARAAEAAGCAGLMVLPPYVYRGDWRENAAHFRAVLAATGLPCMLYNNPVAYGVDVLPDQVAELAEAGNLVAVKESSTDVRRITALKAALGDRLALFVGVDDVLVEGVAAGAVGWVAGLVNAFPAASVRLFELARRGGSAELEALYAWFLPLLRLDTVPKFVQCIKLAQDVAGCGAERVRAPKLTLVGAEREATLAIVRAALAAAPAPEPPFRAAPVTGSARPS